MNESAVKVSAMSKTYPGIRALNHVSLSVRTGSVHGLVGENGAGKSTLIRCLAGVTKADAGEVRLNGELTEIRNAADARQAGLAFIHQELNLIEYFSAAENVFLGHSLPKRFGLYSRRALGERARAIFDALEVKVPLDEPIKYLTPGQRAMVAIARAFAAEATIYFMDEPATALTDREKGHLFAMIERLVGDNRSVVYVTHNLDDILRISDEITVLRDGQTVGQWNTPDINKDLLIAAMIGEELQWEPTPRPEVTGESRLSVTGICGPGVGPVSFSVKAGEILGIGGLVGSGRSTLLHMLLGAVPLEAGGIEVDGVRYDSLSPPAALRAGIVLIPEERRSQGLALNRSVLENAIVGSLNRFSSKGFMKYRDAQAEVLQAGGQVKLKTAGFDSPIKILSGGNQQKVLFGRALLAEPKVLLLDEPTKGVDVGARHEIYEVIRELAATGVAILLVSSDFEEVLTLCDRLLFLHEGRQGQTVVNANIGQEEYLTFCYEGDTSE